MTPACYKSSSDEVGVTCRKAAIESLEERCLGCRQGYQRCGLRSTNPEPQMFRVHGRKPIRPPPTFARSGLAA
jgi:hypothetical protein